jgi:hypothetical protein
MTYPRKNTPHDTPEFTAFWHLYDRKIGKKAARQAFPYAIAKTDIDTMLAALDRQQAKPFRRISPLPAVWLHQEGWQL